jgi:tRNA threonylcarbamoyladenosine biosynthesis protein TsaE
VRESDSITVEAPTVEAMRDIGRVLAASLAPEEACVVVELRGELGAGKTTLVGALLNAFGYVGHARSPTYTLVEPYELAGRRIHHFDLYRLRDAQELEPLGMRDLQEPRAIFLIEWPERAEGALPAPDLSVRISYGATDGRVLSLEAHSAAGRAVLGRLGPKIKP